MSSDRKQILVREGLGVLRDSAHRYINRGNFIPGIEAYHAIRCQIKYFLEFPDCRLGSLPKDSVFCYLWNTRISIGNYIQLLLDGTHTVAAGTGAQDCTGIGGRNTGNFLCGIDVNVVTVKVSENLDRCIALVAKGFASPLGHESRTGYLFAVAVLGKDWLLYVRAGKVIVKNIIHSSIDGIVNIAFRNPFVVKSSGGGNSKIISP